MIYKELTGLEARIRGVVTTVLTGLTRKLNESLTVILQSTVANAEAIENGISYEIKEFNSLLNINDVSEEFEIGKDGCELNPFIKIDYIPAESVEEEKVSRRSKNRLKSKQAVRKLDPLLFNNDMCETMAISQIKTEEESQYIEDAHFNARLEDNTVTYKVRSSRNGKQKMMVDMNADYIQCEQCDYNAINQQKLKSHIRNAHHKNFTCEHCKYASRDNLSLLYHVRAVHEKRKDYKCTQCEFAAGFNHSLTNHMRRVHNQ